jgi:hypothetical protein
MADGDAASREWVVEPPGPGEVLFHIATGDGVSLTEEQENAVFELMRTLEAEDAEVSGHAKPKCPNLQTCDVKSCPPLDCGVLSCGQLATKLSGAGGFSIMGSFNPA